MANKSQLDILRMGVRVWNDWRAENPDVPIDLSNTILWRPRDDGYRDQGVYQSPWPDLTEFNGANFINANLQRSRLDYAYLKHTDFAGADLSYANLSHALLQRADFSNATLSKANLSDTDMSFSRLQEADLRGANFQRALLEGADMRGAIFDGADFGLATMGTTVFGYSDLSHAVALETVSHTGPSSIATQVFVVSGGKIPDVFLWGCGLSDWEIAAVKLYNPGLNNEEINQILYKMYDVRATQAIQISPLFISYSHANSKFVGKVGESLKSKGIRYWRDTHGLKSGRMEAQIDRAIRQNPTVLLVLSEHSLKSDWVEHEVRTARGLEKELGRDVLCPVALDDSWKDSRWPKRVMEQIMEYNILDFSAWQDDTKFDGMFRKLIDGLELFYKG